MSWKTPRRNFRFSGVSPPQVCLGKYLTVFYCPRGSVYPRTIWSLKQRALLHEIAWIIPNADCLLYFQLSRPKQLVLIKSWADGCHSAVAKFIQALLRHDTRRFPRHVLTLKYTPLTALVLWCSKASLISSFLVIAWSLVNVVRIINSASFWLKKPTCHWFCVCSE